MIATTIEQSKELVRLGLDPKTADMFWRYSASLGNTDINGKIAVSYHDNLFVGKYDGAIPAWSLSALLEVMPKEKTCFVDCRFLYSTCDGRGNHLDKVWCVSFDYIDGIGKDIYNKDKTTAAYEMVCWLLRNNLIEKGGQDD